MPIPPISGNPPLDDSTTRQLRSDTAAAKEEEQREAQRQAYISSVRRVASLSRRCAPPEPTIHTPHLRSLSALTLLLPSQLSDRSAGKALLRARIQVLEREVERQKEEAEALLNKVKADHNEVLSRAKAAARLAIKNEVTSHDAQVFQLNKNIRELEQGVSLKRAQKYPTECV